MNFSTKVITGTLAVAVFSISPLTAAQAPQIPAPKAAGKCTQWDHLPPVCPYIVFLAPEQIQVVQGMYRQNVQMFQQAQ